MSEREHRASSVEETSSVEPMEGFIRSAVLGLAFGAVLFMVSDQTGLAEPLLRWLHLPAVGEQLGPKQLVIVGVLLGVSVNVLDHLVRRVRRWFGNLEA